MTGFITVADTILGRPMSRPVALLALIGALDMLLTLAGLSTGLIGELNPVLNWAWMKGGVLGFVGLKSAFTFFPCLAFVWAGTKQPRTADRYAWVAVGLYLLILFVGIGAQFI